MATLSPRPLPQALIAVSTTGSLGARFTNFPGAKGSKQAGFPYLPWLEVVSSFHHCPASQPPSCRLCEPVSTLPLLAGSWQDAREFVTLLTLHACCGCHYMREQWLHRSFTLTTLPGRAPSIFALCRVGYSLRLRPRGRCTGMFCRLAVGSFCRALMYSTCSQSACRRNSRHVRSFPGTAFFNFL